MAQNHHVNFHIAIMLFTVLIYFKKIIELYVRCNVHVFVKVLMCCDVISTIYRYIILTMSCSWIKEICVYILWLLVKQSTELWLLQMELSFYVELWHIRIWAKNQHKMCQNKKVYSQISLYVHFLLEIPKFHSSQTISVLQYL